MMREEPQGRSLIDIAFYIGLALIIGHWIGAVGFQWPWVELTNYWQHWDTDKYGSLADWVLILVTISIGIVAATIPQRIESARERERNKQSRLLQRARVAQKINDVVLQVQFWHSYIVSPDNHFPIEQPERSLDECENQLKSLREECLETYGNRTWWSIERATQTIIKALKGIPVDEVAFDSAIRDLDIISNWFEAMSCGMEPPMPLVAFLIGDPSLYSMGPFD